MTCASAMAVALVASGVVMRAQTTLQTMTPKVFEVASIKPNRSDNRGGSCCDQPGGRLRMINGVVENLIQLAYPSQSGELVGAPAWVTADRYDVLARGDGNPTPDEMRQMVRALLADRFKLSAHYDTQDRPIFALVRARADGRLAPALRLSSVDCTAVREARRRGRRPDAAPPANGAPLCGYGGSGASIKFGGVPMSRLAEYLRGHAERVVIDKTGLDGNYKFALDYELQPGGTDAKPDVFTALQEQLGLKLVPDRAPLQVLVVDHIERPTED